MGTVRIGMPKIITDSPQNKIVRFYKTLLFTKEVD